MEEFEMLDQIIEYLSLALEASESGYYRFEIAHELKDRVIDRINKIEGLTVETYSAPVTYNDEDEHRFLRLIEEQSIPGGIRRVLVIDLTEVSPEEDLTNYFAFMNVQRDKIAGNPNGPVLVMIPPLSTRTYRYLHKLSDLDTCCSHHFVFNRV